MPENVLSFFERWNVDFKKIYKKYKDIIWDKKIAQSGAVVPPPFC